MLSFPALPASIPSPPVSSFSFGSEWTVFGLTFGPFTIHFYALCILFGIVVATIITNRRLTRRGAESWVVIDIALPAVILAFVGARAYHVLTHWGFYFTGDREWWNPTQQDAIWNIWDGGIAIFGALLGGALGAWIGCRWTGIRFSTFADAIAPGLILAQAFGRFGNWFNQELFGLPTDLPWGLEIDPDNAAIPAGLPEGTLFHPTFLYEVVWNALGAVVLLWLGRRVSMQWGRLLAVYLIWYGAGRVVWESIRIDPSDVFLGLRTNVWAALAAVVLGIVVLVVQANRHYGVEPSPYTPKHLRNAAALESEHEFVDVSDPAVADEPAQPSPQAAS
ncbi:MAG: prolipoprotein diacylglyceryl transferase [Candidatus Microbacterium stercoravium]|uniref:Phosphatidylglycerol--prolipoprotein diacylglyceryl transferase n=1 Tax=Candidatus Microbacterium stercoravium TaxID=2838697 RepID=A0A9D2KG68_9MICO|nr:prolipoprotein diacylglyceryl transferase [Candidatus Microbacterium stercoravium]